MRAAKNSWNSDGEKTREGEKDQYEIYTTLKAMTDFEGRVISPILRS